MRYNALISMRYNALKSMRFIDVARAREKKKFFCNFWNFWTFLANFGQKSDRAAGQLFLVISGL